MFGEVWLVLSCRVLTACHRAALVQPSTRSLDHSDFFKEARQLADGAAGGRRDARGAGDRADARRPSALRQQQRQDGRSLRA